jgi:putative DNA primase/helicase
VVKQIAGMIWPWPFPVLAGVIGTPTLRPDFSLLVREGYDTETGLYLMSGGLRLPAIPERPTRDDAAAALVLLDHLLENFPFVGEEHRSAALSLLMTPVLRGALPVVPLHLIDAHAPGSGKSYLADIAAIIATGEPCAVFAQGEEYPETEKRLIGAALAGFPIINLDNCRRPLKGDFLCQVTERPLMALRPLGGSEIKRIINVFTMIATANNAVVVDDAVRRTLRIAVDPNMEAPEEREFPLLPINSCGPIEAPISPRC